MQLATLGREVAAWEETMDPSAVTIETTRQFVQSLHHFHLPKLAEHDIVEYDPLNGTVETDDNFSEIATEFD